MRRLISLVALSFCTALSALAVPVTFQIDLGPRINLGEFDATSDVIEVRGDFTEWNGGFQLTNTTENPTIYRGTRDIAGNAGSETLFKFVQVRGDSATWENDPNRRLTLPATATTLPVFYFNNVWEGAPIPVTFQVNMATQQAAGAFVPGEGDFVEVRGSFQGWTGGFQLTPSASNPDVYEGTAEVATAPGARVEYKFVINKAAGQVNWENDPNRAFTLTAEPQTVPVVYFNNVTGVPVKAATSFAVDLSVYIGAGLFDTNAQEVYIRGNKVGWDAPPQGLQLFADASRPGIYTNTHRTDGQITGDLVEYKAVIWDPVAATPTWEDGGNKTLTFSGTEPKDAAGYHQEILPVWYFNNVQPGSLLNEETVVTFRVDMNNARIGGASGTAFNPATDTVAVNGAFLAGGWQPWDSLTTVAVDDGTGGDVTANDGIYTVQVTVPRGANSRLVYKYGVNGQDNEAAVGNDRVRYVRATGTYTLPVDVWGTITQENETEDIGEVAISRNAGAVTINWTAQPGVRLQRITNLATGEASDVAGTEGQGSYTVQTTGQMGFFRLAKP